MQTSYDQSNTGTDCSPSIYTVRLVLSFRLVYFYYLISSVLTIRFYRHSTTSQTTEVRHERKI